MTQEIQNEGKDTPREGKVGIQTKPYFPGQNSYVWFEKEHFFSSCKDIIMFPIFEG